MDHITPTRPLLDYAETQRELGGVSRNTVKRMLRRGDLVRVNIGSRTLITRTSIEAFIERAAGA